MTKKINLKPRKHDSVDYNVIVSLSEMDYEKLEELKEQYGLKNKSAAVRYFTNLGMRSAVENDPRHSTTEDTESQQEEPQESYRPPTVRELIPEGEENSLDMSDELWDEKLRDEIMDVVSEDPQINRDGFEVYR
jgi:hypothetical protein